MAMHIGTTPDASLLRLVQRVYDDFGLSFEIKLSTRPAEFLGEIAQWDHAEAELRRALDAGRLPAGSKALLLAFGSGVTVAAAIHRQYLARNATMRGDRPAYREKEYGIWQTTTWGELAELVRSFNEMASTVAGFNQRLSEEVRAAEDAQIARAGMAAWQG